MKLLKKTEKAIENLTKAREAHEAAIGEFQRTRAADDVLVKLEAEERKLVTANELKLAEYEARVALESEPNESGWDRAAFTEDVRAHIAVEEDLAKQLVEAHARTATYIQGARAKHTALVAQRASAKLPPPSSLPSFVAAPNPVVLAQLRARAAQLFEFVSPPPPPPAQTTRLSQVRIEARQIRIAREEAAREREAEAKDREKQERWSKELSEREKRSLAEKAEKDRAEAAARQAERDELERAYKARQAAP